MRKQLHYEWHWFWDTGNGEMGNNGIHVIDVCRWALGRTETPPRAMSIGGRFGFPRLRRDGQHPDRAPGFPAGPAHLRGPQRSRARQRAGDGEVPRAEQGVVIDCEGGYFAGDGSGASLFDKQGQKIRDLKKEDAKSSDMEVSHMTNFLAAVRSRKASALAAEALQGHLSAACCHMANVSHRLGAETKPEAILEAARADRQFEESFTRCREYLRDNGVDLGATPAVLGAWLTMDPQREEFTGQLAARASQMSRREYRPPFVVPQLA